MVSGSVVVHRLSCFHDEESRGCRGGSFWLNVDGDEVECLRAVGLFSVRWSGLFGLGG